MIDHAFTFYIIVAIVLMTLIVASIAIPFYGFMRKRWKGLAIGCLLQPIVCGVFISIALYLIGTYDDYDFEKARENAMVVLRKTDKKNHTHNWYLKVDEECLYEYSDDKDGERRHSHSDGKLFDVVPMDSCRVCVDDVIVVTFDFQGRKVTAVDYDEPIEVVSVDWDKVNWFFSNHTPLARNKEPDISEKPIVH